MDSYENRPLLPTPLTKRLKEMTDKELTKILTDHINYNVLIPGLIEANLRKDKQIAGLTKRIAALEQKTLQKPGRPRREFYVNDKLLDDDYLVYLIDYGYYDNISKMEKDLRAGKNQLRNRYNKAKKKQQLEKEMNKDGNR